MAGTAFKTQLSFGDAAGPTWQGGTTINPGVGGSNAVQINQSVAHNASVTATAEPSATTYDVSILAEAITVANLTGFGFACILTALNGSVLTPVVYVKLKAGITGTKDYIIPLVPGQSFVYTPILTTDANGATYTTGSGNIIAGDIVLTGTTITSITVTPDKYADVQIVGTIELST